MDELIKRVLFADDDDAYRDTLGEYFSDKTSLVWEMAENGVVALDKALANAYDLIILDINMPFMKGNETLKAIKQQTPQVKVLAFTGKTDSETIDTLKKDGFDEVICKPVSLDNFELIMRQHLYAGKPVPPLPVAHKPKAAPQPKPVQGASEPKKETPAKPEPGKAESIADASAKPVSAASGAPQKTDSETSKAEQKAKAPSQLTDEARMQALAKRVHDLQIEKAALQSEVDVLKEEISRLKEQMQSHSPAASPKAEDSGTDEPGMEVFEIE